MKVRATPASVFVADLDRARTHLSEAVAAVDFEGVEISLHDVGAMLEHKFEPEVYERLEAAIQGRSELGEYYGSPEEVLEDLQECVFILGVIVESLRKMSQRGVMRGIDGGQRDDPR